MMREAKEVSVGKWQLDPYHPESQGPGKVDVTVGDWRRAEVVHFA